MESERNSPPFIAGTLRHVQLTIGTWNCFGMGQGLDAVLHLRAPHRRRFEQTEVIAQCTLPDVLCIQELFSRDAQRFFDSIAASHAGASFRDDNRVHVKSATVRGTGLGVSTRFRLDQVRLQNFSERQVGWDRLSRKGALYARVHVDEERAIDLITVHLQAGYDARAAQVRASQLADLRKLLPSVVSSDRPSIVCGDFNIDGLAASRSDAAYQDLMNVLDGFIDLGAADDFPTLHPHADGNGLAHALEPQGLNQRVDYIFWRPGRWLSERPSVERFFDKPCATPDGQTPVWASDHYGLRATFTMAR